MISLCSAILAAVVLALLAALHAYWGSGGFWPGRDSESLARIVVGSPPGTPAPGPGPCWAVAVALLGAMAVVLGAAGLLPLPMAPGLVREAGHFGALVLLLRGLIGGGSSLLRPRTGNPYVMLDVRLYSPLCLLLSLLFFLAAER